LTVQETVVSTSRPTIGTAPTARLHARRVLRPLLVFVLVLRCVAALPPHRATTSSQVDPQGPLGRLMATTPVETADQ
jgi:hypothetical protein